MAISRTPGAWPAAPAQSLADPRTACRIALLRSLSMRIFVAPDIIASPPKGPAVLTEDIREGCFAMGFSGFTHTGFLGGKIGGKALQTGVCITAASGFLLFG
ncbi:putative mfs sugar transporter protein [Lasiodiplodia theobromae]|uniref:MFS sugar transporter n=1 Tax=Lasiodiplodia theobromae TaxID=45133 RepID=UPI0015C37F6A